MINESLTKSYSLLWSPSTFGVHNGTDAMSCSARTTRQWCTFLRPGRRKSGALCSFCAIYCLWQLDIILPLQLYICLAFITRLLMLSLSFPLAGVSASGARGFTTPCSNSSTAMGSFDISTLDAQCHNLLVHGLASSTRNSYASGQRKCHNFCSQLGKIHPSIARLMNGRYAFSQHSSPIQCNTPPGVSFCSAIAAHRSGLSGSAHQLPKVAAGASRRKANRG